MPLQRVRVRIPATTANLGPGFDCLGIALKLYNTVSVTRRSIDTKHEGMIARTADFFFRAAKTKPFPFHSKIEGAVPRSRGLGSSVTVRLGLLAALNALSDYPLEEDQILAACVELEGHPDNAVPAFYGGFAACAGSKFLTTPVQPRLKFVALIPETPLETKAARRVLPKAIPLHQAVENLQNTALITAAFCSGNYEVLPGLFRDHFHQPHRAKLLPCFAPVIAAAEKAGALGAFLSGSGSTLMAVTLEAPEKICAAMLRAAQRAHSPAQAIVLTADNTGLKIRV
jgi:homoserine kinase